MRRQMKGILTGFLLCTALFLTNGLLCRAQEAADTYTQENPDTGYRAVIEDDADLLSDVQETELAVAMYNITAYGNVAFKTVSSNGISTERYAKNHYESLFEAGSGTLFLIDMDNRMLYIYSEGAIYKVVTKAYANTITDNVYRYASEGDYYECAAETFRQIFTLLEGDRIAQPMKYISNALLAMILALLINYGIVNYFTRVRKPGENEILKRAEIYFNYSKPISELVHQTKTYDPVVTTGSSGGSSGGRRSSGGSSRSSGGGSRSSGGSRRSGGGGGHRF